MNKPKLLIWADSPAVSTGFGIVVKNLCNYLYKDFEIGILGINHTSPLEYDREKYAIYRTNSAEMMGFEKFGEVVDVFHPDVILLFQDIFQIFTLKGKHAEILKNIPTAIYFPVDGRPFSRVWKDTMMSNNAIITYTEWGRRMIKESIPEANNIEILPHGIDTSIFHPLPQEEIEMNKTRLGWNGKFVITNVNRYQPRKHINQTLRIASMLIKGYKSCKCGNLYPKHLFRCDLNDCNSSDVEIAVPGNRDIALYLHMNMLEPTMGTKPSDWLTSHALNNGFVKEDVDRCLFFNQSKIYDKSTEPTPEELNILYNVSDVLLSTSFGEGFGFSTAEAMATGTQVVVGKHSANIDLLDNGALGKLTNNLAMFNWGRDAGHVRPIMDPKFAITAINEEFSEWSKNKKKIIHQDLIDRINSKYLWPDKAEKLKTILNNIIKR